MCEWVSQTWSLLHDFLSKDSAPAWVQAIGSVIAIGVAVAIPAWQHRTARRDAKNEQFLQARSLVFGVSAELLEIEAALEKAEGAFTRAQSIGQVSSHAAKEYIGQTHIEIHPMLLKGMDRFYLLGEPAGLTLPQLVSITLQHERQLAKIVSGLPPGSIAGTTISLYDTIAPLHEHVKVIRTLLQQINSELHQFDIVKAHPPQDGTVTRCRG